LERIRHNVADYRGLKETQQGKWLSRAKLPSF
jgi:hemin uptake protein HemP